MSKLMMFMVGMSIGVMAAVLMSDMPVADDVGKSVRDVKNAIKDTL